MAKQRQTGRFSDEVRERAVRLVRESEGCHPSQWAALVSVSGKIGCTAETLRRWVREARGSITEGAEVRRPRRGGARPPVAEVIAFVGEHRVEFGAPRVRSYA